MLWIGFSAGAQDSLAVYLKIAAVNNPTVRQRFAEYKASLQKIPQAGALPDPQLEMGVFLNPMEVVNGKQITEIKLMQMFPWFGVLKNAKDEMSQMAQMKYEAFRDAKLQVFYEVQKSWFNLYRIRREIKLTLQNIELLHSIERMSVIKFSASSLQGSVSSVKKTPPMNPKSSSSTTNMGNMTGNVSVSAVPTMSPSMTSSGMTGENNSGGLIEVYEIQSELLELENALTSLQNAETVALARFNLYLNRGEDASIIITDTLTSEPLDTAYLSVNDSLLGRNPMLGMLWHEQQSLDSKLRMQKKMGYPMLGVGVNYSVINRDPMSESAMNGRDMIMPMITVTLPIYRKKYQAMQTETRILKEASEENSRTTLNELRISYLEALQQYYNADRFLKLYSRQRDYLQKSLSIILQSYSTGSKPLSEVQSTRRRLLEYDLKYTEALSDFNTAKALITRLIASTDSLLIK